MWLREACRHAIDAAQDSLASISNQYKVAEACKVRPCPSQPWTIMQRSKLTYSQKSRFTAFFIESSCTVLLYDILRHPSKHAYNLEFINTGLRCLEEMANDEPIINASTSIGHILQAVEQAIASELTNVTPSDDALPATFRQSVTADQSSAHAKNQ
jgi:hypothetical protein